MTLLAGGCLCRAIRYEATGEPIAAVACHCRDCQYLSGGGPTFVLLVPRASVTVTAGTPSTYWSRSDAGSRVGRHFCGQCGTPLFGESAAFPEIIGIRAGSLDDPGRFRPGAHMWVSSAQPWHGIDPALPRFEKNPP